jgi:hypothetical protein
MACDRKAIVYPTLMVCSSRYCYPVFSLNESCGLNRVGIRRTSPFGENFRHWDYDYLPAVPYITSKVAFDIQMEIAGLS